MKKRHIIVSAMLVVGFIISTVAIVLAAPTLTLSGSENGNDMNLTWTNSDTVKGYGYEVKRSVNDGEYQDLGDFESKIQVLNIYPDVDPKITINTYDGESLTIDKSASLKQWMESSNSLDSRGYGRGLIEVTPVSNSAFNANPGAYLKKNADGSYNYNVLVFGTWDSYQGQDLSDAAYNVVNAYLASGASCIVGHDTVRGDDARAANFAKLRGYFNIKTVKDDGVTLPGGGLPSYLGNTNVGENVRVRINTNNRYTTYPWYIGGAGTILTVPACHDVYQVAYSSVEMSFADAGNYTDQNGNGQWNYYLTVNNNCAMIQTGHSGGSATQDEQKVWANLLFYLGNFNNTNKATDSDYKDINAPEAPVEASNELNGINGTVSYTASDIGTKYSYYVKATEIAEMSSVNSNTVTSTITSGVARYNYVIDGNESTTNLTQTTTSTSIDYTLQDWTKTYLHIQTVDAAGNVSEISHILLHENIAPEINLSQNPTAWTNQNVVITATTSDVDGRVVEITKPDNSTVAADNITYTVETNGTYTFIAKDNCGATTPNEIEITNIDKVKPNGKCTSIDQPTSTHRAATIHFAATDDASGVAKIDDPSGVSHESDITDYDVTVPGTYTFRVWDVAGNYMDIDVPVTIVSDGVIVKYVDVLDDNADIAEQDKLEGNIGDTYTTEAKDVDEFELVSTPDNKNGNFVMDITEVVYGYKQKTFLVIKHLDKFSGEELEPTRTVNALHNDAYTTEKKTFDGYVYDSVTGTPNGNLPREGMAVTYYYLKQSDVNVKYVDYYTGSEIADPESETYSQGVDYTTNQKTIEGYTYFKDSGNTDGTMGNTDIDVTYFYKKDTSVTAIYEDYYTHDVISSDVEIAGVEGDDYTTEEKEIDDYLFYNTEGEVSGKMSAEPTVVKYLYKKLSTVTTKYVDISTGQEIANPISAKYAENAEYTSGKKAISGYTFSSDSGNTSGTIGRDDVVVIYYYKANSSVVVRYIDINTGSDIEASDEIRGNQGDSYTTNQKAINGYEFVEVEGQTTGSMGATGTTVIYKYKKLSKVFTYYVDETSNTTLRTLEPQTYAQGDEYTTTKIDINGYTYTTDSGNTTGTIGRDNVYVTYYYKKITNYTVKYLDYYTKEPIIPDIPLEGVDRQPYTTEQKEFDGYEFVEVIGIPNGLMDSEPQTITYRYKKVSNLIVHHIDANTGEKAAEDTITPYKQGDKYEASSVNIPGYVVVESPEKTTGKMEREDVEKTYYYKEISDGLIVKYVDIKTNEILDQLTFSGNVNDEVEIEYKPIIEYYRVDETKPDKEIVVLTGEPQEVIYHYVRRSEIYYKGIDQDTGEVLYEDLLKESGVEGEIYDVAPRMVEGYTLVKIPDNARGIYSRNNPIVIFEYKKNAGTVNVKYVEKATNNVIEEKTLTGNYGTTYTTENKTFDGYRFIEVVGPTSGTYEQTSKEVVYYYERISSTVTLKYIDEDGNQLEIESKSGDMGDTYNFTLKEIEGYEVLETPQLSGIFTDTDKTLIVKLKKTQTPTQEGTIVVNLVDKDGNVIGEAIINAGEVGKTITITAPEIDGYRIVGSKTVTATYINGRLEYDIVYEKVPEKTYGTIIVKFLDENDNPVRPQQTTRQETGVVFKFEVPEIEGYEITGEKTISSTYTDGEQIVIARYTKIPDPVYGSITVRFVDENNVEIKTSITKRDEVGKVFKYTAPQIDGYELPGEMNIEITYVEGVITYTFKYTKIPDPTYGTIVVKFVDETGKEIKDRISSKKVTGTEFSYTVPEINGYEISGDKTLTATYSDGEQILEAHYTKVQEPEKEYGKIIVKYVDEDGYEIKVSKTYEGEVGTTLTTTAPNIEGYELVGNKAISEKYVSGEKTVVIKYQKIEQPIDPGHKDEPAPVEPTHEDIKPVEEKTVDTSDINVYGLIAIALGSILLIRREVKKSLEK